VICISRHCELSVSTAEMPGLGSYSYRTDIAGCVVGLYCDTACASGNVVGQAEVDLSNLSVADGTHVFRRDVETLVVLVTV